VAAIVILLLGLTVSTVAAGPTQPDKQIGRTVNFQAATPSNIGFPYSAGGLLLLSFSSAAVLIASGVGLKVFLAGRRDSSRK